MFVLRSQNRGWAWLAFLGGIGWPDAWDFGWNKIRPRAETVANMLIVSMLAPSAGEYALAFFVPEPTHQSAGKLATKPICIVIVSVLGSRLPGLHDKLGPPSPCAAWKLLPAAPGHALAHHIRLNGMIDSKP